MNLVSAGGSYFVNYDKVEPYIKQLVEYLQKEMTSSKTVLEATELSFAAHFDLVSIHPFYDGKGRTSRFIDELYPGILPASTGNCL